MESTLSRRERERLMRREAMLRAAQAVFAEKGYTQATLEEIAQRAEFGKGTLYNYFEGGKEAILYAIFDDLYHDFLRMIEDAFAPERASGRRFPEVFHGFILDCFTFFDERRDQFMVMIKEAQRLTFADDEEKATYFQQQGQRVVEALAPHLDAAVERGEMRPLPSVPVAHMIFGNIKGFHMHARLQQCQGHAGAAQAVTVEEAARFVTTFLLEGLLARPEHETNLEHTATATHP